MPGLDDAPDLVGCATTWEDRSGRSNLLHRWTCIKIANRIRNYDRLSSDLQMARTLSASLNVPYDREGEADDLSLADRPSVEP